MAIEVRIPTILRTYTDGAKQVEGAGSTLGELLIDLDAQHGGLRDAWWTTAACAGSSTCTSTTRTSASWPAWTPRSRTGTR